MSDTANQPLQAFWNKVPQVTIGFWLIKIMSTTVGETVADYLAVNVGWGAATTSIFMAIVLIIALFIQFSLPRYVPSIYWLTVVLVSIVGTQITDLLTDKLEISLYITTGVFAVILAAIFASWYQTEHTLSMQTIVTRRREAFYWLAILCTFALGTAAGDLATEALGLGFKIGVVIFSILIALAAGAYFAKVNAVLVFWVTYILTRPLGASLGDLLSQSSEYGGLGWGAMKTSVIFLSLIVIIVTYLTVQCRLQHDSKT